MRSIVLSIAAVILLCSSLGAQSVYHIVGGVHAEGAGVRPGVQMILSRTSDTGRANFRLRGEIYGSLSRIGLHPSGSETLPNSDFRALLGTGLGVQWERNVRTGPFLYLGPTLSRVDDPESGRILPGLAGGAGLVFRYGAHEWKAEFSWRGHGVWAPDEIAVFALSFGRQL